MPLAQLIYHSRPSAELGGTEVSKIVREASQSNASRGITGYLLATPGHFVQVLEGDALQINGLFQKIARDERHHQVALLHYGQISVRRFSRWSMGSRLFASGAELFLRFGSTGALDPAALSGEAARELLAELAASDPGSKVSGQAKVA